MRTILFLVLTIALSLPWWWLSRDVGGYGYITLLMWSPAAASILALKLTGGNLSELGGRNLQWRWVVAGWLLTVLGEGLVYGLIFGLGLVDFPSAAGLAVASKLTGLVHVTPFVLLLLYGVLVATAGALRLAAPALGEEIGWRGFLAPALCSRFGFTSGALLSGLIWSAWHFPLMIGKVSPVEIANFTVTITGMGVAYAWFRLKSNSLWPSTVMHGLHNALGDLFFLKLVVEGAQADKWLDETGFALPALGIGLAVVFIFLGRNLKPPARA